VQSSRPLANRHSRSPQLPAILASGQQTIVWAELESEESWHGQEQLASGDVPQPGLGDPVGSDEAVASVIESHDCSGAQAGPRSHDFDAGVGIPDMHLMIIASGS
jgi:hypothetical protein